MVKKKGKFGKKSNKKEGWLLDDVTANCSLPPQVEGQVRCYLRVSVSQIVWIVPGPPIRTLVKVRWWGESGPGTFFRPLDVKKGNQENARTVARFPVRSGPKQLAAYFADMASLVLEIIDQDASITVGRSSVDHLPMLVPGKPINGFFPVLSVENEKVAELQVSLVLESLMDSYESPSSVPTPDISLDVRNSLIDPQPVNPPRVVPTPQPVLPYTSSEDPFSSPLTNKSRSRMSSSQARGPIGVDRHIFGAKSRRSPKRKSSASPKRKSSASPDSQVSRGSGRDRKMSPKATKQQERNGVRPGKEETNEAKSVDLVAEILERGNKLREAMILSTLHNTRAKTNVEDMLYSLETPAELQREGSTGDLLREVLQESPVKFNDLRESAQFSDLDEKAVNLILGSDYLSEADWKKIKALQGNSPASSISGIDDDISDLGDPLHDQVILEELFYKNPDSEESDMSLDEHDVSVYRSPSANSLDDPGNRRPRSRHSSASSFGAEEPVRDTDPPAAPKSKRKKKRNSLASESDILDSTKTSETSRVSFDPTPSDAEETSFVSENHSEGVEDGLSVERLTLLGKVHVARVVVDIMSLSELPEPGTPKGKSKLKQKGKPPRPAKKTGTYFVEYSFPVVASSRDQYTPNTMATEVVRIASKKVDHKDVYFNHRSVFPIMFDGESIEKWWKSALVFKFYKRASAQKVPRLLGMCSLPLKKVLKSEALYMKSELNVRDRSSAHKNSSNSSSLYPSVGNLKVDIELGSDSKDFPTALARTRLAEMRNPRIVPIPQKQTNPVPQHVAPRTPEKAGKRAAAETQTEPRRTNVDDLPLDAPNLAPPKLTQALPSMTFAPQGNSAQPNVPLQSNPAYEPQTLYTLLYIPDGQNITLHGVKKLKHTSNTSPSAPPQPVSSWKGRDMNTRNLYLVARMFWCDDFARSNVCWGTFEPIFNFQMVSPVLLTKSLLERMRNNMMVIEVWDKKTTADADQLVGMVKLSLHQFYMSFRDQKIVNSLFKSQYPVVTIDSHVPIVNPFSGAEFGQLKVLLAMGSEAQVAALQRLQAIGQSSYAAPERPVHFLERQEVYGDSGRVGNIPDDMVEHVFEVSVESIQGLRLQENLLWGEADCFVQYHFPTQTRTQQDSVPEALQATPTLKSYRTATTLCIPDPTFRDVTRHTIVLPEGTPVQREILNACAGAGGASGGVPFEVWCRYYHPNVRDQVIAKCILPLSKLCAMVTMQQRGELSVQTFSLPLSPIVAVVTSKNDDNEKDNEQALDTGTLEVTFNYKAHIVKGERLIGPISNAAQSLPGAHISLSVGILRASGLKAAAQLHHDAGMQYAEEVGVNSYVRVQLSFLQKQDERLTRTVARNFAPDYSYHMDFSVPLLWTASDSDALSLAEILESAEAIFEIWHQVPKISYGMAEQHLHHENDVTSRKLVSKDSDILLGVVTVPLKQLLTHKTGIVGWHPIRPSKVGWKESSEEDSLSRHGKGLQGVVGGLELSIKFGHQEDLDRVYTAARTVGWAPDFDIEHRDWESADESSNHHNNITVDVDKVLFPVTNALIVGQTKLDPKTHVYIRYKFYNKKATFSKFCKASVNDEDYIETRLQHKKELHLLGTAPLSWYLHEERLEMQVWVTFNAHDGSKKRPAHRDKLVGSAFLPLHGLADSRRRQHRISGIYPLFKPGAINLGGACLQAHITLKSDLAPYYSSSEDEQENLSKSHSRASRSGNAGGQRIDEASANHHEPEVDFENTFVVHVNIDRAYRLPDVRDATSGNASAPNSYVGYQTADKEELTYTDVVPSNNDPVWAHDHQTRLPKAIFSQNNKALVLKVWHKTGEPSQQPNKSSDRVLGFVAVDLVPLLSGFHQVSGWYNIMDFNGGCQGQIKVAVTPQDPIVGLAQTAEFLTLTQEGSETSKKFLAAGFYNQFPSHLTNHTDQKILHDPAGPGPILQRFAEHYQNVKKFHEHLHSAIGISEPSSEAPSGLMYSNLRSNLAELDEITLRLKQRLLHTDSGANSADRSQHHPRSDLNIPLLNTYPSSSPSNSARDHSDSTPLSSTAHNIPMMATAPFYFSNTTLDAQDAQGRTGSEDLHISPHEYCSSLSATTTFIAHHEGTSSEQQDTSQGQSTHRDHTSQPNLYDLGLTNTLSSAHSGGLGGTGSAGGTFTYDDDALQHLIDSPRGRVTFKDNIEEAVASTSDSRDTAESRSDSKDLTTVTPLSIRRESGSLFGEDANDDNGYIDYQNSLVLQDEEDQYDDEDVVVPRSINEEPSSTSASFMHTMKNPLGELYATEQLSKFSEEDSWFSNSHMMDDQPLLESIAELVDNSTNGGNTDAQNKQEEYQYTRDHSEDQDEKQTFSEKSKDRKSSNEGKVKSKRAARYRQRSQASSSDDEESPLPGAHMMLSDNTGPSPRHRYQSRFSSRYRNSERDDSQNTSETGETQGFNVHSDAGFMHEVVSGHDFSNTYKNVKQADSDLRLDDLSYDVADEKEMADDVPNEPAGNSRNKDSPAAQSDAEANNYSDDWEKDDSEKSRQEECLTSSRSEKSNKSATSESSGKSAKTVTFESARSHEMDESDPSKSDDEQRSTRSKSTLSSEAKEVSSSQRSSPIAISSDEEQGDHRQAPRLLDNEEVASIKDTSPSDRGPPKPSTSRGAAMKMSSPLPNSLLSSQQRSGVNWPNFFPEAQELEASMKTLTVSPRTEGRVEAAQDLMRRFTRGNVGLSAARTIPKPTPEQSQRIAKIFSARFTT